MKVFDAVDTVAKHQAPRVLRWRDAAAWRSGGVVARGSCRIIPLEAGHSRIMVQGGPFFPDFVEARLAGSTFGGTFLTMHWIGGGLQMEINSGGERFVTSPVRSFWIEQDGPVHNTH